ncbi:hypothetical protein O1611_g1229 [Lasiodiplodia mahajangana]|uniref:Uncharacterized protein n=1 Tax=Lasiodiplodia mahajangana TaxID=1108764 RepID=A0ACC2JYG7_9PEZI|nr:hypothetical protein O1611_g1229 [Lasiodiplodia mahajangana]
MSDINKTSRLLEAALGGDLESVNLLLNENVDINATDDRNRTYLHLALLHRRLDIAKVLIENGIKCNARSKDGATPLHYAAQYGIPEAVKLLIPRSSDINAVSYLYGTALASAARGTGESEGQYNKGCIECAEILISSNADVNCYGGEYHSPLQTAAFSKNREMVELLLASGAEVDAQGGKYTTALYAAVCAQRGDLIRILLKAGASPTITREDGVTILASATSYPGVRTLEIILAHHKQAVPPEAMAEAARAAAGHGHHHHLKMLLEKGAVVRAKDSGLRPILFDAFHALYGHPVVEYLLGKGRSFIDIDETDAHNTTALAYAIANKSSQYVKKLLDAGANPNIMDDNGDTPLILAAKAGDKISVELLLSQVGAAALDEVDFAGRGVLYWACYYGHEKVFNTVMEHIRKGGPEMKKRKAEECNLALHAVATGGVGSMLQTLQEEMSANTELLDRNNWSIRRAATAYGNQEACFGFLPAVPQPDKPELLRRPTFWNRQDSHRHLEISDDGLRVTMKDPGEVAMARSDFCMPINSCTVPDVYYFEITIEKLILLDNSERGTEFAVGFCQEHVPLNRVLGMENNSWGLISSTHYWAYPYPHTRIRTQTFHAGVYKELCCEGDIIGCGVNFLDQTAFCTKNGHLLENRKAPAYQHRAELVTGFVANGKLYPAVSFGKSLAAGSSFVANFGNRPEIGFQFTTTLGSYVDQMEHGHTEHNATARSKGDLGHGEDSNDSDPGLKSLKSNYEDTSAEAGTPDNPKTLQLADDNTHLAQENTKLQERTTKRRRICDDG